MTSTPTTPVADPGPPPPAPPGLPRGTDRFFAWVAGLGVARADGWLGGVCAGLAARLRIDPLIVRGIVFVLGLFGFPVLFLYAVAWALLPDADGRIHLRELIRGRFDSAIVGIGILVLSGFVPLVPWTLGILLPGVMVLPGYSGSVWSVLSTLVVLAVVAGLVFLIVRSARRTDHPGVAVDPRTASADPSVPGKPADPADSGDATAARGPDPDAAEVAIVAPAASGSAPEPLLTAAAMSAEVAAWRMQHEAWKVQDDAWRRQQQDAERIAREQAQRERQAAGEAFAAEADAQRSIRRATRPRTSSATVATVVGLALVAGVLSALWAVTADLRLAAFAAAIGFFVAALVVALGMVVAGIARRRSGFLAFLAVIALCGGTIAGAAPVATGISFGSTSISNVSGVHQLRQPFGDLAVILTDTPAPQPITIVKGTGRTDITVQPGVELYLDATLDATSIEWMRVAASNGSVLSGGTWPMRERNDGSHVLQRRIPAGEAITTNQTVTLEQSSGSVVVSIIVP